MKHNFNTVKFGFLDRLRNFKMNVIVNIKVSNCLIPHHAMKECKGVQIHE